MMVQGVQLIDMMAGEEFKLRNGLDMMLDIWNGCPTPLRYTKHGGGTL